MNYEAPKTERTQLALEGNICTSYVVKDDPANNAEVTIAEQEDNDDRSTFEFNMYDD